MHKMSILSACVMLYGFAIGTTTLIVQASPVTLLEGFLQERLASDAAAQPDTDAIPRRSVERMALESFLDELRLDLVAPSPGQDASEGEIMRRRRLADMHVRDRRWESALQELEQLMRMQPGHLPHVERAATVATLAGRYASADVYFRELMKARPNELNLLAVWSGVLLRLQRFGDAEEIMRRAMAINPEHLMVRHNQLLLALVTGEPVDEVYWQYRPFGDILLIAGWLVADERELQRLFGTALYENLVRATLGAIPVDQVPHFHRTLQAVVPQLHAEDWQVAYNLLESAQAMGVTLPYLQMERIRCLVEMGKTQQAVQEADELLARYGHSHRLEYMRGYILVKAQAYQRAVDVFANLLATQPTDPEVLFAHACALAGAGRMDEAWPILDELSERYPERFPVWMHGDEPYLNAIRSDPRYRQWTMPGL